MTVSEANTSDSGLRIPDSGLERPLVAVIMAGGSGTRFWPMSTTDRPKQFISLFDQRSLLQLSYDRIAGLVPPERVLVVTSAAHAPLVHSLLPELPAANVIGEPLPRDTAGAVGLAAALIQRRFPRAIVAILTADHLIRPIEDFRAALVSAVREAAASGSVYTFGIEPSYPATAYGYVEQGEPVLEDQAGVQHYELRRFREKPDLATAQSFLSAGNFLWNSGMFVWPIERLWGALEEHLPGHVRTLGAVADADGTPSFAATLAARFGELEKISVDYALMEKISGVRIVKVRFEWHDVGGWLALEPHLEAHGDGQSGRGFLASFDSRDNLVFCEDATEVVGMVGVRDLVIVRSGNRTLVAHRKEVEKLKHLVENMRGDPKFRHFV